MSCPLAEGAASGSGIETSPADELIVKWSSSIIQLTQSEREQQLRQSSRLAQQKKAYEKQNNITKLSIGDVVTLKIPSPIQGALDVSQVCCIIIAKPKPKVSMNMPAAPNMSSIVAAFATC